jgi:hypothetical protein
MQTIISPMIKKKLATTNQRGFRHCGCVEGCKGLSKLVSYSTYARHAKYRAPTFSPDFLQYLDSSTSQYPSLSAANSNDVPVAKEGDLLSLRDGLEDRTGNFQAAEGDMMLGLLPSVLVEQTMMAQTEQPEV